MRDKNFYDVNVYTLTKTQSKSRKDTILSKITDKPND